uniref:Calponin-homology (CH) domain-containing protein n=1 Tax=Trichogramma kaykai TaxID=54128 RepID=A0ABD2W8E3_9HYME
MSLKIKSLIYQNECEKFMNGPLCEWLCNCLDLQIKNFYKKPTYSDLVDGMMMHQVFLMTDLNVVTKDINVPNGDPIQRLENLRAILDNIKYFFEEECNLLLVQVPKIHLLAEKPMNNIKEMELLLKLLFGCSLKCPRLSIFMKIMEKCKESTQMELIKYASEMTERCDVIFDPELVLQEDFNKSSIYDALVFIRLVYKENIICQSEHSDFAYNTKEKLEEAQEDLQHLNIKFQKVKCELQEAKENLYHHETYANNLKKENQILGLSFHMNH